MGDQSGHPEVIPEILDYSTFSEPLVRYLENIFSDYDAFSMEAIKALLDRMRGVC
jgi:hypothetical protein